MLKIGIINLFVLPDLGGLFSKSDPPATFSFIVLDIYWNNKTFQI